MSIQDNLLNEFPQHSVEEWKEKINKDLKTKSFDDLTYIDSNGLNHEAFYTKENLDQELTSAIQNVQKQNLDWNILENLDEIEDECIAKILEGKIIESNEEKGFNIDGVFYKDQGSTIVNELTAIVQHLMYYTEKITDQKLDIVEIIPKSTLYIGSGLSYFSEIAKYRALRFLCSQILVQYNVRSLPKIVGVVSSFYYSHLDAHTNLLRATSMGMSSILGGVDELYITPFDYPKTSEKGKRWAMNIQRILKHESHFEKILDPSAGSYYVESLTANMVKLVWSKLKAIESEGGMIKLNEKGKWLSIFKKDKERLLEEYKSNKTFIGVNKYLNEKGVNIKENSSSISNSIVS